MGGWANIYLWLILWKSYICCFNFFGVVLHIYPFVLTCSEQLKRIEGEGFYLLTGGGELL